ncbi:MAG TPA: T9SS type A sorting domain-containing protein [Candidatus Cloacimonetes bacterium]|nr:T9SS type A sorting domain-containing protein [Candidatus Cloacimonadota bacterium]HEX38263.1 T9SS type A sorting domain-containing protein [Candidatus Cloacimonadota bacterium]
MKKLCISLIVCVGIPAILIAQPWIQNNDMFNPSGVPSLPFSQPRFGDLDGDGDQDMVIGNINDVPFFVENVGSQTSPDFLPGTQYFAGVSILDAEMGVFADLNDDGDLDFIAGGYTGLNFFENIGTVSTPIFQKVNNFFSGINVGQNPVPDLADVNDDNALDMLVGYSEDGSVKIYFNTGTASVAQFSETSTEYIGDVGLYAYPIFCDLDNDGDQDILVGKDTYEFVYYQNNGTPQNGVWEVNASVFTGIGDDTYWNSPDLVDLNGDSTFDLVYGTAEGPLHYYENDGTPTVPAWQVNTSLFGGVLDVGGASNPVFYDFDGDGDLDLVSGSQLGDMVYYENIGTPYSAAWHEDSDYFTSIDHSIYSSITLGDVYGDGNADALCGDLSGNFFFHSNTGLGFVYDPAVLNWVNLGGWSNPRFVDMDDDDDLDIVAGNEAGNLFYFENQGTTTTPDWVEITGYFGSIDVGSNCTPTVIDYDGDGDMDVLTGNLFHELHYYENIEGSWIKNTETFSGLTGGQNATPALADLDNDGDYDLTIGNYSGTFDYYENQFIIVSDDPEQPVLNSINITNYPNPFRTSTTISFLTKEITEPTEIKIYNIKGQLIRKIHPVSTSPSHQFVTNWDGKDQGGKRVTPGIYFYEIKADGKTIAFAKCLLIE